MAVAGTIVVGNTEARATFAVGAAADQMVSVALDNLRATELIQFTGRAFEIDTQYLLRLDIRRLWWDRDARSSPRGHQHLDCQGKDLSKANFCFSAEIKGDPLVSICEGLISLMDTVQEFGTETLDSVNANLRRQIAKATQQRESIAGTLKEARRELNNRRDHRKAMINEQQRIRDEAEAELEGLRETIRNAEEAKQAAVEAALGALEAAKREKTGLVNRKRAEYHEELEKAKSHQRELADQERELKHKRFTLYGQVERDVMTALKLFKDNDRGCLNSALRIILYQISLARGFYVIVQVLPRLLSKMSAT